MAETKPASQKSTTPGDILAGLFAWIKREPLGALLALGILATLGYFFAARGLFLEGRRSVFHWAWDAWNPEANQEHSVLVVPIMLCLLWHHRDRLRATAGLGCNSGLWLVATGAGLFILSVRMVEARYALLSVPFLILGITRYLWGAAAARVILFPCVFFLFTIPMGAIEQATNQLQFIITGSVSALSNLIGVKILAIGTSLNAADGTFNFEIAEGCSGVRSLIAMAMLASVYVHLTQRELWKKVVIFAASGVFAIIGNVGRIFTVVLVARFVDKDLAGGLYHDYSGFIFFPIALGAMVGFAKLLDSRTAVAVKQVTTAAKSKGDSEKYDY